MAARLRKHHQEDVRTKIQATQLVNVLQNHALGIPDQAGEMTPTRMKAIEILLRKTIPDLSAVTAEHSGPDGQPIQTITEIQIVGVKPDADKRT
jgi:hypothetical protein